MNNLMRNGNFTSSQIYRLLSKKKGAADEYILECNMERRLARALNSESSARPLQWGHLLEKYVSEYHLGLSYQIMLDETVAHPKYDFWVGSPDCKNKLEGVVSDIKAPYTCKSFCQLVDGQSMEAIRENHKDGEKFFWQLVSNAILTDSRYAELLVFMPFFDELEKIKEMCEDMDDPADYYWIHTMPNSKLPYLPPDSMYKNFNRIRFEVTKEDKDFLTSVVDAAGLKLERIAETV